MAKKKINDDDIIITCDKKPACYEHIARLEVLKKYRKLNKELGTAVNQYNAVVSQNKDLQTELNDYKRRFDELYKLNKRFIDEKFKAEVERIKYKTALNEVKEIAAKAQKDICNNCGWHNSDGCDPEDYTCGEFIKIQEKIKEVLE